MQPGKSIGETFMRSSMGEHRFAWKSSKEFKSLGSHLHAIEHESDENGATGNEKLIAKFRREELQGFQNSLQANLVAIALEDVHLR